MHDICQGDLFSLGTETGIDGVSQLGPRCGSPYEAGTANVEAVFNRYYGVGYSVILKEVRAIYQTMYLVEGSIGLATCAPGGENSRLFSRITGLAHW